MKILFLTNGYPPRQTAGTESYTAGLATAMARAGHAVSVICAGDWDRGRANLNSTSRSEQDGVTLFRLNLNWTKGSDPNRFLFDNPSVARRIGQMLDDIQPDVAHVTSCYTLSAGILRVLKQRNLPLVLTLTDFWFLCPRVILMRSDHSLCDGRVSEWDCLRCMLAGSKALRWTSWLLPNAAARSILTWISRQPFQSRQRGLRGMAIDMASRRNVLGSLLELPEVLIAPSRFLADMYAANGVRRPIRVIPYGHDLDWAKVVAPRPEKTRLAVGYVGRLAESKGVHVLVEALRSLREAPIDLSIFGDTAQEPAYTRRLELLSAGLPVRFCGRFDREHLAEVYGQLDLLVVPSLWHENNPLVIQEAFAARRPVIASRLGGMAEFVVHEQNGLLFEPGNVESLAQALRRVLADRDLLRRWSSGISRVKPIQEEVILLETIYADLKSGS